MVIRAARESELPLISALEKSGDQLFRAAGLDRIADAPAPEPDAYRPALEDGRLLVAVDERDAPHGFIRLEMLDGGPHVEQVSVHPDRAGQGIGASLLASAERVARPRRAFPMSCARPGPPATAYLTPTVVLAQGPA